MRPLAAPQGPSTHKAASAGNMAALPRLGPSTVLKPNVSTGAGSAGKALGPAKRAAAPRAQAAVLDAR